MSEPQLNGQIIGLAHKATRAALERVLNKHGVTFDEQVVLGLVARNGGNTPRGELVEQALFGLKVAEADVEVALGVLIEKGHVTNDQTPTLTALGADLHASIRASAAQIGNELYGDLTREESTTTAGVLLLLTERANAMLDQTTTSEPAPRGVTNTTPPGSTS